MAKIEILSGLDDRAIAEWLHTRLERALAASNTPVAITVPGGSTPFPVFQHLVELPLDWSRLTVWPGDDREVPEDHPASNTGKIRALFEPAGAEVVALSVMEQVPRFALAWLGMGGDGHIASLFPNTDPRADDPQPMRMLTPDPLPPEAPFDRITLTIPALLNSDQLLFVIRGEEKRALFEEAACGGNDLPIARLLAAANQPVTCFT
ncbi:6-phosphogluconolactonase [Altererythrobacter salegens]|uniref:6-phosphogluconolactonase n=1 Tax=Croceibacterium salegens TaxID=1737568 RepID=A0A6I4SYC6_9SPHN|nr:6-phosphogluconolactonase [Croceibacterium salegens]MXO60140.1 6-phosphogluconolactonase [Croceibacterium salegens]